MRKHKTFILPALSAIFIFAALCISMLKRESTPLSMDLIGRYFLVSAISFILTMIISTFKREAFLMTYTIATLFAGIYLIIFMPSTPVGFSDLGVLLSWMLIILAGIVMGIFREVYIYYKRKSIK